MRSLRLLWVVAPLFVGACSVINAPDEIKPGTSSTGGGGTGGSTGGTGGDTTTTTTSSSGGGGMTTTTEPSICGDGKVTGAEACDDDNTVAGDGCSAKCEVEAGFSCTDAMDELSICTKLCGNGTVDAGEECDDMGAGDDNPATGDQDPCDAKCKFKEFDVEAATGVTNNNELPTVAFRKDAGVPSFYVVWHSSAVNKLLGREYKFDGSDKKGTGSTDMAPTGNPDAAGERICTASSNRSLIFWRDADGKLYSRKIDPAGALSPAAATTIPVPEPRLSCAASPAPNNSFIVATTSKAAGTLWDVLVQPFNSFSEPAGAIVDAGDALGASAVSTWPLSTGFLVAWVADPAGNGPIGAQQLDVNGGVLAGFIYTLSDAADVAPREPWGERIGMQDQFAFTYTRDSVPDVNGASHREVVVRIFKTAGDGAAPIVVSADVNPQSQPRIAANPGTGKFVVTWTGGPPNTENVFYRAFDMTGAPLADEKATGDNLAGQQTFSSAVVDPASGDTAIVWDNFTPNSGKPHKISAKLFSGLLK